MSFEKMFQPSQESSSEVSGPKELIQAKEQYPSSRVLEALSGMNASDQLIIDRALNVEGAFFGSVAVMEEEGPEEAEEMLRYIQAIKDAGERVEKERLALELAKKVAV